MHTCFLHKLDTIKSVTSNAYLVSLDVKFLYTSITNAAGIKAVKEPFDKHTSENVATKSKNCVLNRKHSFQINGCSWVRYARHPMQIFSWIILRRNIYIPFLSRTLINLLTIH